MFGLKYLHFSPWAPIETFSSGKRKEWEIEQYLILTPETIRILGIFLNISVFKITEIFEILMLKYASVI